MLSVGLMSGTSMDGIDAALLRTDGDQLIESLDHLFMPYAANFRTLLKAAEKTIRICRGNLIKAEEVFSQNSLASQTLSSIITHSTELHLEVVNQLLLKKKITAKEISVIGYHGQTMFHAPEEKISVQVGNSQYLANELGIPVISNFRQQDLLCGGQGAPLAPLYHHALALRDNKIPLAIINCGGISNISIIPSSDPFQVIAYDSGPGNALIDKFIREKTNEFMDKDGHYGAKGVVHKNILALLYEQAIIKNNNNYFNLTPPKSLDIGDIELPKEIATLSFVDACRTIEAFTADSIVESLTLLNIKIPKHYILVGGGWHNPIILQEFTSRLQKKLNTSVRIETAEAAGWNSQAIEAETFAYLAVRSLQKKFLTTPKTTGVLSPTTGGACYYPDKISSDSL